MKLGKNIFLGLFTFVFVLGCNKEEHKNLIKEEDKKTNLPNDSENFSKSDKIKSFQTQHSLDIEQKGPDSDQQATKEIPINQDLGLAEITKNKKQKKIQDLSDLLEKYQEIATYPGDLTFNQLIRLNDMNFFKNSEKLKFGEIIFQLLFVLSIIHEGVYILSSKSKDQIANLLGSVHESRTRCYSGLFSDFYRYVKEKVTSLNQNNDSVNYAQNLGELIKIIEGLEEEITEKILKNQNAKDTNFILAYLNSDIKLVSDSFDAFIYELVANHFSDDFFFSMNGKSTEEIESLFEEIYYESFVTDLASILIPSIKRKDSNIKWPVERWGLVNIFYLMKDINKNINALKNQEFSYKSLNQPIDKIIFLENFHFDTMMTLLINQGIVKNSDLEYMKESIDDFKGSLEKLRKKLEMIRALYL